MARQLADTAVDPARIVALQRQVVTTAQILAAVAQNSRARLAACAEWHTVPSALPPRCEAVEARARAFVERWEDAPLVPRADRRGPASEMIPFLTDTEQQIISLLPSRLSFGQIGERLGISSVTVRATAVALYRRLGVVSRADAVERALILGVAKQT